ncbi:MAG: hypothetical protein SV375_00030 [Thermodesulfobacteriota bacterium]|nr:hypothetical protein [Thermodesulfobacteriota bacterium]
MRGWKTWVAVAGMVLLGIVDIANGQAEMGITKIVGGLGLLGIGHKVEKNK